MSGGEGAAAAAASPDPADDLDPVLVCLPRWEWPKVLGAVRRHRKHVQARIAKYDRPPDNYAVAALLDAEAQIEAALGDEP